MRRTLRASAQADFSWRQRSSAPKRASRVRTGSSSARRSGLSSRGRLTATPLGVDSSVAPERVRLSPLAAHHDVDAFECGDRVFNAHLRREALGDPLRGRARTYVACLDCASPDLASQIVGYVTLTVGVVEAALCPDTIRRRQRRRLIPVVVLARLAVDVRWQRLGVGTALLRAAISRVAHAGGVIGAHAIVAPALDQQARSFLNASGFDPLPGNRWHLCGPVGSAPGLVSGEVSRATALY